MKQQLLAPPTEQTVDRWSSDKRGLHFLYGPGGTRSILGGIGALAATLPPSAESAAALFQQP